MSDAARVYAARERCALCGAAVVEVTLVPTLEQIYLGADLDHGGDHEVRRGKDSTLLYAKRVGPDPERKLYLLHECEPTIGSPGLRR